MSLTDRMSLVTQYFLDVLDAEKVTLGIRAVFDGDQRLIPETPAVAVIPGTKNRELYGAGVMTLVNVQVALMVYHNRLQDVQKTQREVIELSEALEDLFHLHTHQTLGTPPNDLVVFGMFTSVEPGFADRDGTVLRTTRMTWEGQSRHGLPTS